MQVRFDWSKSSGNSLVDLESKRQDRLNKNNKKEVEICKTPWKWDDGDCESCDYFDNCKLHEDKK